jgi:anaerobic magnesium-protoporphyrin IX monomethyl ester cyclase
MRCALIIPAWGQEDIFPPKTSRLQVNYWQPLGLLYVAAALMRAGHQVQFLDGSFLDHEAILSRIRNWQPGFAGIYSNTFLWKRAQRTAEDIKKIDVKVFTCVGGPHPSALEENCLLDATGALDAMVAGEGEHTVTELVQRLELAKSLNGVRGVIFRNGEGITANPLRPPIEELDTLPFPARELIENPDLYVSPPGTYRHKPVATMMTSRGCLNRCVFCFQMDGTRRIRYRGVENVMEEIEDCLSRGYREIRFLDDTFTADYHRVLQIVREIRSRNLKFDWFASSCAHQVDKALLKAMKDAGCWAILFGAESGLQKHLNTLKKGTTLGQIANAVRWAKEVGLSVVTPFLVGIPGETFEDGLKTIAFACQLDPHMANFHTLTPFPGTELYETAQQHGALSSDHEDFTFQGMAFVPYSMTRAEMVRLRSIAFRAFYSRPKLMLRKLLAVRGAEDIRSLWNGLGGLISLWAHRDLFSKQKDPYE